MAITCSPVFGHFFETHFYYQLLLSSSIDSSRPLFSAEVQISGIPLGKVSAGTIAKRSIGGDPHRVPPPFTPAHTFQWIFSVRKAPLSDLSLCGGESIKTEQCCSVEGNLACSRSSIGGAGRTTSAGRASKK